MQRIHDLSTLKPPPVPEDGGELRRNDGTLEFIGASIQVLIPKRLLVIHSPVGSLCRMPGTTGA